MNHTHQEHIEKVIENTINGLRKLYNSPQEFGSISRIIFPNYWVGNESRHKEDKKIRISEQELRFLFVEEFNKYCNSNPEWKVYYSVETPTSNAYKLSGEGYRSGCIDLCIYDENQDRLALIEFKTLNPTENEHAKDAYKLVHEKVGKYRYFIEIVENCGEDTVKNIQDKLCKYNEIGYGCLMNVEPKGFICIIASLNN